MAISIIIPTYNRAELLRKTLGSIINQTSSEWECIVVDDFSQDDTKEVVEGIIKENDQIFYIINTHKKGAQGARNTGLDYAHYDWVIFFDSDNIMHNDFVYEMCNLQQKNIDRDVLACCSDIIDIEKGKTGKVMNPCCRGYIHDKLFTGYSYVDFNQAIIRKSKLIEIGGLDEECPSMQEWDTHIRLSNVASYQMTESCLIDYFKGGKDAISSNKKREVLGRLYILEKHLQDWKRYPKALSSYSYLIYNLIKLNADQDFVKEKISELRSVVPYLSFRIALCKTWNILSKIRKIK